MSRTLTPEAAARLIVAGGLDVVDVCEPHEYAAGHIEGARNVPLGDLKADPKSRLPRDKVLLVCARGVRSQTAAKVADDLGLTEVYHLEGGLQAWQSAGFPVMKPTEKRSAAPLPAASALEVDPSCGIPEPGLDALVGANMRSLRAARNLTLDQLASLTGLSRTVLGQIELGKTPPSVSVVWRIAQAFNVHFSALLASTETRATRVLREKDAKRLVSPDGRYSSRALYLGAERADAEFYELFLAPHSREDAHPHQPGTRENLIVTAGRLDLYLGQERFELAKGDAIVFTADIPHSYVNPGKDECWMCLVMTYASGPAAVA